MTTETLPPAIDAGHLTDALRRCGTLGDGRVRDVAVESSRATLLSRIIRLRLSYDGDGGAAPGSLIFKTGLPGSADRGFDPGRREVEFYSQVAAAMPAGLVPRCFEAAWDADSQDWHLLLEDLTDTHTVATAWPLPPTAEQCEHMLRALARIHAAWWDDPRLGVAVGTRLDAATAEQYRQRFAERFTGFCDRLSAERRKLYELFMAAMPRLLQRTLSGGDLTIAHGDAHVWNSFLPRDGGGDVRYFDWDAWRIGVATGDLAYMMATHWYPERRRRLERLLLDRYHAALVEHGVGGYDRRALDDDYRLSVLWQLMTPVWQSSIDLPPMIWWSHLERITAAVDDLGCRDLLA